ncbi:sensor domain-containing diguanylate cyclase [Ketobacter sp.]
MPSNAMQTLRPEITSDPDHSISAAQLILRFRELHRLSLSVHKDYNALYKDYLETGLKLLGMKIGIASRIENNVYTIRSVAPDNSGFSEGDQFALGDTYCSWVVEEERAIAIDAVGNDPDRCQHPVYQNAKLETYLAAPIWVEQQIYGTLNFTDTEIHTRTFCEEDVELVELMALGIGQVIERDLLDQRRQIATQRMNENIELFESAFKYASNGMALVATDGHWLRVNQALLDIVGYTEDELLALDFQAITHPEDLNKDLNLLQDMLDGKRSSYQMEKRYFHANGAIVWVQLSVSMVTHENGSPRYFISQINDISSQKKAMEELFRKRNELEIANRKLKELAIRDGLTKVHNRRSFDERLQHEFTQCYRSLQPLCLLLIDIDHFKEYNDNYGHPEGDQALKLVARTLVTELRAGDLVARFGGEEFAVILPCTNVEGGSLLAERIRIAIELIDCTKRALRVSIGVACFDANLQQNNINTVEQMIACADNGLYQAKGAGRNLVKVGTA